MIHNQCHVFFSTPKIFFVRHVRHSEKNRCHHWPPNLAIMFHQQGLVESLTLDSRYNMLGSQDSQDYDTSKDRTTPQKKKEFGMVGTQEPAIHNMFYHSELCKTLQNYLCCRNVHVSYYVIMLYHHVYSFVISKWHKNDHILVHPWSSHISSETLQLLKNPAAAPAAPTALFDPRGRLRSASCHRMRRGHWAPRAAKGCRSRQRPWRGGAFGEPNGALFGDVEHGGKRTFIVGKEVLSLISWKKSRNEKWEMNGGYMEMIIDHQTLCINFMERCEFSRLQVLWMITRAWGRGVPRDSVIAMQCSYFTKMPW